MKEILKYLVLSNIGRVATSFVILLVSVGMVQNMIMEDFFYILELVSAGIIAIHVVLAVIYAFIINPIKRKSRWQ